jgi:DNA-directed RNA polymerase specialized sigma24 family protein
MRKNKEISSEAFEKMLSWLDADRTLAAQKYEAIRFRLVKFFDYRRCADADALTDQVFDRVLGKMDSISDGGNPAAYFYKVADFIYRENLRKPVAVELSEDLAVLAGDDDYSPQLECLKICLKTLPAENRRLIVSYYEDETAAKIASHKKTAAAMGIDVSALYTKVFRLRQQLQKCVLKCVAQTG